MKTVTLALGILRWTIVGILTVVVLIEEPWLLLTVFALCVSIGALEVVREKEIAYQDSL